MAEFGFHSGTFRRDWPVERSRRLEWQQEIKLVGQVGCCVDSTMHVRVEMLKLIYLLIGSQWKL